MEAIERGEIDLEEKDYDYMKKVIHDIDNNIPSRRTEHVDMQYYETMKELVELHEKGEI